MMSMISVAFRKWKTKVENGFTVPDMKTVVTDGFRNNDESTNGNGNMIASVDRADWDAKKSQFTAPDYILK